MIKQVLHETTTPVGPAGVSLALAVAYELHSPAAPAPEAYELRTVVSFTAPLRRTYELRAPGTRVPVVPVPQMMGLRRTDAVRPHRCKVVPLSRLTLALN
ncbi:hypothetical protein [Streptomyces glomeratus]|uniref:Uncharacterized protein n=1 Tax=Streptomyces glomeratus TaxID=284452 RepID=A0ABP6LQ26_9ACTN|nr:hypothetical protein [Streptomyces glomeratus]MCF1511213.1 hypothetical protein [Streptomyces glomeratus]